MRTHLKQPVLFAAVLAVACPNIARADFKVQTLTAGPYETPLKSGVLENCGSIACSVTGRTSLSFSGQFQPLPACEGELVNAYLGIVMAVDPVFYAGILDVPEYDAGVNSNLRAQVYTVLEAQHLFEQSLYFNQSADFNTARREFSITNDFPIQSVDSGFLAFPAKMVAYFAGSEAVPLPLNLDFDAEATISQIGMAYVFRTAFQVQISLLYEYAPRTAPVYRFEIVDFERLRLTFASKAGQAYALESKDAIESPLPWTLVKSLQASGAETVVEIVENRPTRRFFRLRILCP